MARGQSSSSVGKTWYGSLMVRWRTRALFIMVLSFLVAMVGTIAVIDAEQPLAKTDGLWMMAFALLAVATAAAAVLSRNR